MDKVTKKFLCFWGGLFFIAFMISSYIADGINYKFLFYIAIILLVVIVFDVVSHKISQIIKNKLKDYIERISKK